jgi:hypothetical protein
MAKGKLLTERARKISETMKRKELKPPSGLGHKFTTEELKGRKITWGNKISLVKIGKPRLNYRGDKHHGWKGGLTPERDKIRKSIEYKLWRLKVFERDKFTCQECGQKGGKLNAHHVKSFSQHKELIFEVSNGTTLCVSCHKKTENYLRNHKKNGS